jgi:hypothetical protein
MPGVAAVSRSKAAHLRRVKGADRPRMEWRRPNYLQHAQIALDFTPREDAVDEARRRLCAERCRDQLEHYPEPEPSSDVA